MIEKLHVFKNVKVTVFVLTLLDIVIDNYDNGEILLLNGTNIIHESLWRHKNWNLLPHQECGRRKLLEVSPRTVNGRNAKIGEFPWLVKLYLGSRQSTVLNCGGSIINDRYILTAAHCCEASNRTGIKPIFGAGSINTKHGLGEETLLIAKRIIPHPNYTMTPTGNPNDICLVRVDPLIVFTDTIQPICLPIYKRFKEVVINGTEMELAGWGSLNIGRDVDTDSSVLQKTRLKVYESNRSAEFIGVGDDTTAGFADSGCPLMIKDKDTEQYYVFGVLSTAVGYHVGRNSKNYYSFYPKVYNYIKWILNELKP